jgi:2-keto-3-deoxy-L-rhamnonate aldolase RhmA
MWTFASEAQKRLLVGTFIGLDSIIAHQLIGDAGYDFVIIDMEHTPMSAREATIAVNMISNSSKGSTAPLVRVPSHGLEWIKWGLDSGAAGVVVPMVESRAQVEQIVERSRYPPVGSRSFGPLHAPYAHPGSDRSQMTYFAAARHFGNIAVIPMIETAAGVENADAILAAEGVSAAFIGPYDLRVSLGLEGGDGTEKVFLDALKKVVDAGRKAGKPVGLFTGSAQALQRNAELGFRFFAYHGDTTLLANAARTSVKEARSTIAGRQGTRL